MKERTEQVYEIDLLRLAKALWHRAWLLAVVGILTAGIAFSYAAYMIAPTYQASTLLYVNNSAISIGSTDYSISTGELSAAQSLVDTYVVILNARTTLEEVIRQADVPYTYEELSKMISAGAVNGTEVFRVTVTSTSPEEARLIANTISTVLPNSIADVVSGSDVRVVDRAVTPKVKVAPNVTKYTAVGLMIGLVLSAGVVILMDMFDDVIRDTDYLTQNYEMPILAVVPNLKKSASGNYGYTKGYGYGYGHTPQKEKGA